MANHPTNPSFHYQSGGLSANFKNPNNNQQQQQQQQNRQQFGFNQKANQQQYAQTFNANSGGNSMLNANNNNNAFPSNNNQQNRQRNFTTQNNNFSNPNQYRQQQQQQQPMNMMNRATVSHAMNPQQMKMRNSMPPQQQQMNMMNRHTMSHSMNPQQMRKSMPPQQGPGGIHKRDKTKVYGQDPAVPAPPSNNPNASIQPPVTNRNALQQQANHTSAQSLDSDKSNDDIYGKYNKNQPPNQQQQAQQPTLQKAQTFQPGMNRIAAKNAGNNMFAGGQGPGSPMSPHNLQPQRPGQHYNKTASTGSLFPNNQPNNNLQAQSKHFASASTGNVIHKRDKTKVFGQDPNVPAPPGQQSKPAQAQPIKPPQTSPSPNRGARYLQQAMSSQRTLTPQQQQQQKMASQRNLASQRSLTPQQQQQMMASQRNLASQRSLTPQQQQQIMVSQRNMASARNVNQHQRQVQRRGPQGGWGPQNPWFRYHQQQRMMGGQAQRNPYYQQWMAYYQRMAQNPQGQLQRMVMQQQQMIANLKRQLQERDKHYHQTIQTTINFKDIEINELREQITKLEEENDAIGELQVQNFKMKQELNNLRGDHQTNIFDNLLDNMTSRNVGKTKVAWPGQQNGGLQRTPSPKASGTELAKDPSASVQKSANKDPKAALNAMLLKAKASPSEMLLKPKAEDKKKDSKADGRFAKYAKMKKIGMPMVSIVNRMRMDGMSPDDIEQYTGEKQGSTAAKKPAGPKININLPKYDKYRKMKKLGMPMKSIVNKMKLDGLSQEERDAMEGKETSTASSKEARQKAKENELKQLAITLGLNPKEASLPSKVAKMKRIHWEIVELSSIRKTFWEEINKNSLFPDHIDLGGKFELDFQVRARKPRLTTHKAKIQGGIDSILSNRSSNIKLDKHNKITWLGSKRNQAIQIALKRVGLPNEVIYDAIVDMDEEVLQLDLLEVVWEISPTSEEQTTAEMKVDEIGDDMELVGVAEMFHIEMSTIPEIKQQLSKWLFARSFREIYMDRLQQVNIMQKCATKIKSSMSLREYLRIILSVGNLMNHGSPKGIAYGFKLESVVKLMSGIKDYGGKKDLSMWLYQFAYNKFEATRTIFDEFIDPLKRATRLDISSIEQSIVKMADEFVAIDLFCRRLHDDFHPGDTEAFRIYMDEFQQKQAKDMMNLKVKIQNASSICKQVAKYYHIDLEDNKPEHLFIVIQKFVEQLQNAKRSLLKIEKERLKREAKAAKERERAKNKAAKKNMSVADRIANKKQKAQEDEEKGNLLFLDIKNAADSFAQRQAAMSDKLTATLKEKKALASGKISDSAKKDSIKRRVSAQVMDGGNDSVGGLDMNEINRLRALHGQGPPPHFDDTSKMGNSLMIPGMNNPDKNNDDEKEQENENNDNNTAPAVQWDDDDF